LVIELTFLIRAADDANEEVFHAALPQRIAACCEGLAETATYRMHMRHLQPPSPVDAKARTAKNRLPASGSLMENSSAFHEVSCGFATLDLEEQVHLQARARVMCLATRRLECLLFWFALR
jgi:hypothetical protein